jgi:hypothetical protein
MDRILSIACNYFRAVRDLKFSDGRWRAGNFPAGEACSTIPGFAILETMRGKLIPALALLSCLITAGAARADEIRLKDGTKIIGTIVGFESDSFRVETSYGFALIQKDKVADISIIATKKESEPKPKANAPATPAPTATPSVVPAVAKEPATPAGVSPEANTLSPMRAPASPGSSAGAAAKTEIAAPKIKSVAAVAPAPPVAPPPPPPAPEPLVIRDEIRGNQYVNLTYGFQMYKPPSWDLIPAARKALPDAVAALGTSDQTTLMVIGREHAKDSLDAHAATTEKALKDVYENYRLISTRHISVAGFPAVEQRSRGTADGRDWSVILLTLFKGTDSFTLLGMTWADSDLIQVQENVIAKAVNSLTFTTQ